MEQIMQSGQSAQSASPTGPDRRDRPVRPARRLLLAGAIAALAGRAIAAGTADGELAARPGPLPTPSPITETLTVSGAIEQPQTLSVADLRKFTQQPPARVSPGHGAGDKAGQHVLVKGVLLTDILNRARIISRDHNDVKKIVVIATASDGYKVVFSWSELFNSPLGEGVLVYVEKDGKPLGDDEGRIAMISTKDLRTGPRHVKWLSGIEVRKIVE